MATIGSVAISLTAKTSAFDRGIKRSKKGLQGFFDSVGSISKKLFAFGTVAAGAAAAGLVYLTKQSMENIDATAKLSDRLGVATEDLTGLQYAANLMGASNEDMAKGLTYLNKTLGETKMGLGEGKQALEMLGLSADEMIAMNPAEAFGKLSDKINELPTPAEKAAIAMKLFGRSGIALLNIISLGSKGLEAMKLEAEKLGISFDRFDAAQVEAANDAIRRMKFVMEGIGNTLAIKLAPFITALANKLTAMGTDGRGAAGMIMDGFEWLLKTIAKTMDTISFLKAVFWGFAAAVNAGLWLGIKYYTLFIRVLLKAATLIPGLKRQAQAALDGINAVTDRIAESVTTSAEKAKSAWEEFSTDKASTEATDFFNDIKSKSRHAALETQKNLGAGIASAFGGEGAENGVLNEKGKGIGDTFRVINLAQMALTGPAGMQAGAQEIKSSQLAESNTLLRQIAYNTNNVGAAIAG